MKGGILRRCNNRLVHFMLDKSVKPFMLRNYENLILERFGLKCHFIVLRKNASADRVLITLHAALACYWPGVICNSDHI